MVLADKEKKAKTDVEGSEENEQIDDALVLSIEKLQEIRRPVYLQRGDIIKSIPDFWLTAVCGLLYVIKLCFYWKCLWTCVILIYCVMCCLPYSF